ncbi:G2/mitotic-specific cyclin [Ceratobasidium sp. 414]|nr:G2/mitotic-specific cyclin [Ceratobasidium sp. 414]
MSTIPARRPTRATRPINENAARRTSRVVRTGDKPVSEAAPEKKLPPSSTTTVPPPSSALASTTLSAAAALARKRKVLNANTNAEKKKLLKARISKEKEKERADTPGTTASTSTRLVVELPTRKRRASAAAPVKVEEPKLEAEETTASKPGAPTAKRKDAAAAGATRRPKPVDPEPEPDLEHHEDEPESKRRRSNDRIAIPKEKPAIVEAALAVPARDDENPFDVGKPTKDLEEIGLGTSTRWDDLDAEDMDDPLMVAEYVAEIFNYMKELEIRTMPSPVYMKSQPDLSWDMRGILMDWLIQVHSRFRLLPETLFLATNIIDRFLSLRIVSLIKLQLVGITSLFVASKYEEIMAPSVQNFLQVSDSGYTEQEILQAEKYILRTLGWDLSYPNPMSWLRRASKADAYDVQTRTMAKFLVEVSIVEERLIKCPPSLLSASALWLSRLILDRDEWNANLEHYSGYSEKALLSCANVMLNYILQPPSAHESLWKKYSGKKYFKCATYARKWAEQRWPEPKLRSSQADGSDEKPEYVEVDLPAALPILREQITARLEQEARDEEEAAA